MDHRAHLYSSTGWEVLRRANSSSEVVTMLLSLYLSNLRVLLVWEGEARKNGSVQSVCTPTRPRVT